MNKTIIAGIVVVAIALGFATYTIKTASNTATSTVEVVISE